MLIPVVYTTKMGVKMIKIISTIIMLIIIPFTLAQNESQFSAQGGWGSGGTTVPATVEEVTIAKQLALGKGLSNTLYFSTVINHSDLSSLFDGTITFGTSIYNTSEVLEIPDQNDPAVQTSLTGSEDDFKSNVFITTSRNKLVYKYKFDTTINLSLASTTNPLTLDFLGKKMKITNVADADTLTASVDNGSSKTYNDGDAFIGENETDPNWTWSLADLSTQGTAQTLGVKNNFRKMSNSDKPAGVGGCYNFTNDYLAVCLDNLTIADTDLKDYTFEREQNSDFSQAIGSSFVTGTNSVYISTTVIDGLELRAYTADGGHVWKANVSTTVKTQKIWLAFIAPSDINGTATAPVANSTLGVFYKDTSDSRVKLYGALATNVSAADNAFAIARINNGNTKNDNIILEYVNGSNNTALNLRLNINGDSTNDLDDATDDLRMVWGISSGKINQLGTTATTEEAGELLWGASSKPIGAKDEDHRTKYGIIIKNPKSNSASERVMLQIPPNQVYANVRIKGKVIAPVKEPKPSLLAILVDMEGLVNKIRTTTEYEKQPTRIERALRIIEQQINGLKKIASDISASTTQPSNSNSGNRSITDKLKGLIRRR